MAARGVESLICTSVALSCPTLDLSRTDLYRLPQELYSARHVEYLYLEGNKLTNLPVDVFEYFTNLRWLDLRNNGLVKLPSSVGSLKHVKALLLEGNCLTSLPAELGRLTSLSGLNLAGNPLRDPPQHVVEQGTKAVLQYLRTLLSSLSSELVPPAHSYSPKSTVCRTDTSKQSSLRFVNQSGSQPMPISQEQEGEMLAFPTAHRIQLTPVQSSPKPQQRPSISQNKLHSPEQTNNTEGFPQRMKSITGFNQGYKHAGSRQYEAPLVGNLVGSRQKARIQEKAKMQRVAKQKVKIAEEVQKIKNRENLREWRDEARSLQRQQEFLGKKVSDFTQPSETAPFATDTPSMEAGSDSDVHQSSQTDMSAADRAEAFDARQRELQKRIHDHTLKIQQQRSAAMEMTPEQAVEMAKHNLDIANSQLHELRETNREYRFTAFTGDGLDALLYSRQRATHN